MVRIIFLFFGILFTIPLAAKTLDNKAFCEVMAQGREAAELRDRGQSIKSKKLQEIVHTKLKTMLTVGTEIIPNEFLKINGGQLDNKRFGLACLDLSEETLKEYGDRKYFYGVGEISICSQTSINCDKKQLTLPDIVEKIEEDSLRAKNFEVNAIFQIPPMKYFIYSYEIGSNITMTVKITKFSGIKPEEK
ncbi:hypothetical protein [Leptospira levettii]|uniref:Uncharacterized protein n=1 Tax=Leptospira levettii TaxID=2023178 RepID=A0ABY2MTS7_9LEPT|nr:hypothetical protein [Leptospira levettii]TGL75385.1 hypothetical protein EHQ60_00230 [Leptospira levettii]